MSDQGDIDLRGTQGAVVLPGGSVAQYYPQQREHETTMNQRAADDNTSKMMYEQGRELSQIQARLTALEAMVNRLVTLLEQRQGLTISLNQLLLSLAVAVVIVVLVLGVSYARQ
jgi:hypothetical protein